MMAEKWYVHADDDSIELLEGMVAAICPAAQLVRERTPTDLRERLLACTPGRASAAVGPGSGEVDSVNLAAALAQDGHAREVVLLVDAASGSLRSRARRAGIARVLDRVEASRAAGAGERTEVVAGQPIGRTPAPAVEMADDAGPLDAPDLDVQAPVARVRQDAVPRHLHVARESRTMVRRDDAAPIVTVASGRGGVGKSSIVATMACAAASWGMRVAVVDLDLCSGNLFGFFGMGDLPALDPLDEMGSPGEGELAGLGVAAAEGITVWGPCRRPEMAETISPYVGDLLACASNSADLVLVDTSTTWTDAVAEAVQGCDRLLLVGDERAGTVSSMSRAAALSVRLGVARTRIARVTNRHDPHQKDEPFLFRADVGLETARSFPVLEGGDEVAECLSAGQVVQLAADSGDFASSVSTMLAKLLEELGALPDDKRARAACDREVVRKPRGIFARMREAG